MSRALLPGAPIKWLEQPTTQQALRQLNDLLVPDVLRCHEGMCIGDQSKYVTWEVPSKKFERLEIMQITDMQFGHAFCKYERVVEYRNWILSAPNRFMIWTGDMIDAHAVWSPGSAWDNVVDPQSQLMKFVETWAPARHRILGSVGGNHERRAIPAFGDLGRLIASLLRIPYSTGKQLVDVRFGDAAPFRMCLWHGTGGARTKGTVAQTLDRFMQQGDSQFYGMGHLHQAMLLFGWREVRDNKARTIRLEKRVGAVGTSFLETIGTYAEVAGFASHDVIMPLIVLEPSGHWEVRLR